jgi:starch synthase
MCPVLSPAPPLLLSSCIELKYHTVSRDGVDYVFIEHMCYQREGTPYGDASGPFADNLFRFALLSLGALEAPLNLPVKRDLQ